LSALVFRQPAVNLSVQPVEFDQRFFRTKIADLAFRPSTAAHCTRWHATWIPWLQYNMTVRVDTLDALISGSSGRAIPFIRSVSAALLGRLVSWRQQRTTLVMSDEWLQEYRWSNRDQQD
jgi:hypothetical protein